jgi:carbonic anhydrase
MFQKKMIGRCVAILSLVVAATGLAFATAGSVPAVSPDEALQKLMDGNRHFVENKLTNSSQSNSDARTALARSQKPYAIILSCSDSRVPPELVFDKGLGEIFVVRVAGNIPDPVVLGSIEYAAEHLGSPLVMVLGHERCGAVTATVTAKGKLEGNIGAIIKIIAPAIKNAAKDCEACKGEAKCKETRKEEFIECAINANVKSVAGSLTKKSPVLKHLVEQGKLKIVAAKYDLDDGVVSLLK